MSFVLRPGLDIAPFAETFRRDGRVQVVDFLRHDSALALFRQLVESREWRLAVNDGDKIEDYDLKEVAGWSEAERAALDRRVVESGRQKFQFRYETIRLPEYGTGTNQVPPPLLAGFVDFLCSPEMVDLLRDLTGLADVALADGHASRYQAGHFLTAHDDSNVDMGRRAAYVLNLTPQWRPDWGGQLNFYDERANIVRGFTPGFNTLNLFRVPQPHNVAWVTPLAGAPRYAVTGWLRAKQ